MENTATRTLEAVNIGYLTRFLALSGIATILPFYIHNQAFTGPIINAIFVLALFMVGIRGALTICLVPSLMALSGGLLPAVLAPVVPFIMISNVIFVLGIDFLFNRMANKKKGYIAGVVLGASLKYLFLLSSVSFITRLLLKQELATKVAQMMSWPQLATALLGGFLAWIILRQQKLV